MFKNDKYRLVSIKQKIRSTVKKSITIFAAFIKDKPFIRSVLLTVLNLFPKLKYRLKKIVIAQPPSVSPEPTYSSPRVGQIYEELLLRQKKGSK